MCYRNKLCIQCVYYNGYRDPYREGMTDTLALPNLTIGQAAATFGYPDTKRQSFKPMGNKVRSSNV